MAPTFAGRRSGLFILGLLSLVCGAGAGLIGALFRLSLEAGGRLRDGFSAGWTGWFWSGLLTLSALAAVACALAAFLVRRFEPRAAGSGIPHVEAVLAGQARPASFVLAPVKFLGGALAIGAGLALGREGPCVQMGATLSHLIGGLLRRGEDERAILLAAGAGAGLAAAFDAPLAGAVFVLEELLRRLDLRSVTAALGASTSAILVARLIIGPGPEFAVPALLAPSFPALVACLGLGAVSGALGALYNGATLGALSLADAMARRFPLSPAVLVGACAGALAFVAPGFSGGGGELTQASLSGAPGPASALALVFALRFALGAASYAAGTPGGLFAPMLALGALSGAFFGALVDPAGQNALYALVGMAAFFAGSVRAPLTGMILVTEMTNSSTALLPMVAACFAATGVASLLGSPPIYDSLRARSAGA